MLCVNNIAATDKLLKPWISLDGHAPICQFIYIVIYSLQCKGNPLRRSELYPCGQLSFCFEKCVHLRQLASCRIKTTFLRVHEASQPWISCQNLVPPTISMPHYNDVYYWKHRTRSCRGTEICEELTIASMLLIATNSNWLSSMSSPALWPTHARYPSWSKHNTPFLLQSETPDAPMLSPSTQLLYQGRTPTKFQVLAAPNCSFGSALRSPVDHTTASWISHPDMLVWGS